MCTYFTLHYACKHTQTSHRCPRSSTATSRVYIINDQDLQYNAGECGNKFFMARALDDDCISCKMSRGIVPGSDGSGMEGWINGQERKISCPLVQRNKEYHEDKGVQELENVDPALLNRSGGELYRDIKATQHQMDEVWRQGNLQERENVDPKLLNGLDPNRGHNEKHDGTRSTPTTGPGTQSHHKRPRAKPLTQVVGPGLSLPQVTELESNTQQKTPVEMDRSCRLRTIFQQLNSYNQFRSPGYSRPDSPQEAIQIHSDIVPSTPPKPSPGDDHNLPTKGASPSPRKRGFQHANVHEEGSPPLGNVNSFDGDAPKYVDAAVQVNLKKRTAAKTKRPRTA